MYILSEGSNINCIQNVKNLSQITKQLYKLVSILELLNKTKRLLLNYFILRIKYVLLRGRHQYVQRYKLHAGAIKLDGLLLLWQHSCTSIRPTPFTKTL